KHWAKFGGEVARDPGSYRGSYAASLVSTTDSTKWLTQLVEVQPGHWYQAKGYARLASGGGELFLRLSWYALKNGEGSAIGNDDSPASGAASWALLDTGAVQAPANAYSVRVRLMLRPAGPVTALFDDASLVPTTEPAATPTATVTTGAAATSTVKATATARATSTPRGGPAGSASRTPGSPVVSTVVNVAGPHTLRISEILGDPAETGRDGPFEWVELVNVGSEPVSTSGWKLGDATELDPLPEVTVAPGGYLVVAAAQAPLEANLLMARVEDGEIGNALNNDGDSVVLVAPDGTEVDLISYGDDTAVFDPAPPAPAGGETLGAKTAGADPDASNWAITLRPTPGEPNLFAAPPPEETAVAGQRPSTAGGDGGQQSVADIVEGSG
ncbi:MAG: lamin tail domain-containing protein, partial [Dehalococcoidia bacterium]